MELEGYNRLSPARDGRHILVATGDAFRVFDAGARPALRAKAPDPFLEEVQRKTAAAH